MLLGGADYTVLVPRWRFLAAVLWAWVCSPAGLYGTLLPIAMTQAARRCRSPRATSAMV
ncbi:MAG: hypothetical protein R3E68_13145 [Burkholderiaceae bacterium]